MIAIQKMFRAPEGSKIKVFKNAYWNIWTRTWNLIVKNKKIIGFENLNFSFLAWVGQIILKKKIENFFHNFFILYQKIPLVSTLENAPYFAFFSKRR